MRLDQINPWIARYRTIFGVTPTMYNIVDAVGQWYCLTCPNCFSPYIGRILDIIEMWLDEHGDGVTIVSLKKSQYSKVFLNNTST